MGALAPAVRSLAAVPLRAAPVAVASDNATSDERAFLMKRRRGVEPAACGEMAAKSLSARRVAPEEPSVAEPRYIKAIRNGVVVEMEVIVVGGEKATKPAVRRVGSEEASVTVPRPKLSKVRRNVVDGMESSVPGPKPSKACRNGGVDETKAPTVRGETVVDSSPEPLRKRLAAELDALHTLLKKAELLSRSKNTRFLVPEPTPPAPMVAGSDAPPAKKMKRTVVAPRTSPASEVVQAAAEPEKPQGGKRIAPTARPVTDLIAKAQAVLERRRARERARRELLEVERAALPDESIRPRDMEELGIAGFEHIVSTARAPVSSGGGGRPSVLQQLGLFLRSGDRWRVEQE
ncbi:hypothetical protein ACP4OV_005951 [Aristida adscensionis]